MPEFVAFPKIPRLNRDIVITEKIDGTNGAVGVDVNTGEVWAQSRNRVITPDKDNFGFARWVETNRDVLFNVLGHGLHFGEWWGPGIQRGYGIAEKRFSLFNVAKWGWLDDQGMREARPEIPSSLAVVPVIHKGGWFVTTSDGKEHWAPKAAIEMLKDVGSMASRGFMRPEGIVVYHTASGHVFKATVEGDEKPKGIDG